jgi:hypothetical protein
MNRYLSLFFISSILILTSCNGDNNAGGNETESDSVSVVQTEPEWQTSCYAYITPKDTARLMLRRKDNVVEGDLSYEWFEKDHNRGFLKGTVENDLIIAWYTFQSEGMMSVREEIFKMDGDKLIVATGDIEFRGDTSVFSNRQRLNYTRGITFEKVQCD